MFKEHHAAKEVGVSIRLLGQGTQQFLVILCIRGVRACKAGAEYTRGATQGGYHQAAIVGDAG